MGSGERAPSSGSAVPVAVALGSNVGDRRKKLAFGRRSLETMLAGLRCSRIYETEPRYETNQRSFLNACCVGRSHLTPSELLRRLKMTEREAGRSVGGRPYGPRTLDLDLLLFGDRIVDEPGLRVPHPRMAERAFVLVPLADVAPGWVHPELGRTVEELAAERGRAGVTPTTSGWDRRG